MTTDDEYGPPWMFESAITVPARALWTAPSDRAATADAMPPIAQMAAADAMKQIDNAKNEVPF